MSDTSPIPCLGCHGGCHAGAGVRATTPAPGGLAKVAMIMFGVPLLGLLSGVAMSSLSGWGVTDALVGCVLFTGLGFGLVVVTGRNLERSVAVVGDGLKE